MDKKAAAPCGELWSNGIPCGQKKKKILPFMTVWMDLEIIMLREISQSEKRQIPYDLAYEWSLMNEIN